MRASMYGRVADVRSLVASGAAVNLQGNNGETALHIAARRVKVDAISALLESGAAIDAQDDNGWTSLVHAAIHGEVNCIAALLQRGAGVDVRDKLGMTALMHSAMWGREVEALTALLDGGAAINAQVSGGSHRVPTASVPLVGFDSWLARRAPAR